MAYMNQEKKAKIASLIKPLLKQYGIKGSLSVRHHSSIVLNIKSGPIDFISNHVETVTPALENRGQTYGRVESYLDVNPYWFQDHYTGVAKEFLTKAFDALKAADWYNNSDAQIDYFDTAYYYDIKIGQWDKPYQLTK
jgi:hypothetical protein